MRLPWRRGVPERDLEDEIKRTSRSKYGQRVEAGESPEEAAQAARRVFGNVELIKEQTRDVWRYERIESVVQDVRYALRALRRSPGFTAVALLTLALGIGANTAIFSVVESVLLRPLPVDDPDGLVLLTPGPFTGSYGTVSSTPPRDGAWSVYSSASYEFLRDAGLPLRGIAAVSSTGNDTIAVHAIDATAAPDFRAKGLRAIAHLVSGNYFDVIGAHAAIGRSFGADDDRPGAAAAVIVSDHFWRTALSADPRAIGESLLVNGLPVTVVGVMPATFFGERVRSAPDLWVPLVWQPDVQRREAFRAEPDEYWLTLIGRLGPGQPQAAAEGAATAALRRFLALQAGTALDATARLRIARTRIEMVSGARGISDVRAKDATPLTLLLVAVSLVLLVACANVATLLLSRAAARGPEVAVRRTLGATPGRLVRQWLTESAVLALLGAGLGLLLAHWLIPVLESEFPNGPVRATLNEAVLVFTVGVAVLASFLFGLAPALRAGRTDPIRALRSTGRSSRGRQRALGASEPFIILQIALSMVLVLGAALFTRTLINLEREPLGFDQDDVLLLRLDPRLAGYTADDVTTLYRRLYDRVRALPGVERATFARFSPFSGSLSLFRGQVEGYTPAAGERLDLEVVEVGPDYPQTLGMPIAEGRAIDLRDVSGAPLVAMVNETFARRFIPHSTPFGHYVALGGGTYTVVGVVKDALFHDARDAVVPFVFTPMLQEYSTMALDCEIELRVHGDTESVIAVARHAIADTDSRVAVTRVRTMREQVLSTFGPERVAASFVVTFAGLALLLAAVGVYGVVTHSVHGRTNEIGIRRALGAAGADIVWLIAREMLVWVGFGVAIGAVGAEATGHLVANQLFGVRPGDLGPLIVAAAVLAVVGLTASLVPALRALRVHPATALRTE